ncbi:MAG: carbon-nitrogen hydrolase family protein [Gemmatimonadota bacterium]
MRVTVCELPHEPEALASAWAGLCQETSREGSELVLLPEFAFVIPVWETEQFDPTHWDRAVAQNEAWLRRLPELGARRVVSTRPVTIDGRTYNQGYLWTAADGLRPLRRKYFLPTEPGWWESHWFERGDSAFPVFQDGELSFGLNICTELWALETYAVYSALNAEVILSPRASGGASTAKWLSVGVVAAARSGAFSLSSNRVDSGVYGGVGWIINPEGKVLATTSRDAPFATVDIDINESVASRSNYPRYVFGDD